MRKFEVKRLIKESKRIIGKSYWPRLKTVTSELGRWSDAHRGQGTFNRRYPPRASDEHKIVNDHLRHEPYLVDVLWNSDQILYLSIIVQLSFIFPMRFSNKCRSQTSNNQDTP